MDKTIYETILEKFWLENFGQLFWIYDGHARLAEQAFEAQDYEAAWKFGSDSIPFRHAMEEMLARVSDPEWAAQANQAIDELRERMRKVQFASWEKLGRQCSYDEKVQGRLTLEQLQAGYQKK